MTTFLFMGILIIKTSFGQLTFTTDKFNKVEASRSFDSNTITDLGMKFPKSSISKYDKVIVQLLYRNDSDGMENFKQSSDCWFYYLPTGKQFKDNFEGKTNLEYYIIRPKGEEKTCFSSNNSYFESMDEHSYKVVVSGYFEKGTETVWDDRNDKFVTNTLYSYSKDIYTSDVFHFTSNEKVIAEQKAIEDQNKLYNSYKDLNKDLKAYIMPAYRILAARCYNQAFKGIEAFKRSDKSGKEIYETLVELETKYMEIFKAKKAKDLFIKISRLHDFEEIRKVVLEFEI